MTINEIINHIESKGYENISRFERKGGGIEYTFMQPSSDIKLTITFYKHPLLKDVYDVRFEYHSYRSFSEVWQMCNLDLTEKVINLMIFKFSKDYTSYYFINNFL